ncbi:cytochrome P450 family protein [Streptomyces griseofuscus]|uniref:Cytochrome P450 n=4 Tax=Streptomyces TaxID=1883 RepID=A0A7H1QD06_9ACTN|nr:cytochrome P450 [Streptomyces griseofuscus]QNT98186.1 cytochrome P450 [Streptomyces griseofuscus]BAC76542.1 P450-like hydroxylase [Streptomyces rochei]
MLRQEAPYVIDSAGRDLPGEAARLRERGPVVRVVLPGGVSAWAVTDLDLIKQLLTDSRASKDAYRHWPAWAGGEVDESWQMSMWVSVRNMLTAYGEEHARLRRLVAGAFTARRTADLRPRVERITARLLDGLAAVPPGAAVDVRNEFARPLSVLVMGETLGLPEDLHADLQRMVDVLFKTTAEPEEARANQYELYALLTELVAARRSAPGTDLTSELIAARDEDGGEGLSEKELVDTLLLLIGAGTETTVNLIDQAVHGLITHPAQLALVLGGEATWDSVIDETLRHQPVVANVPFRFAVEDIEVGGVTIPKGDPILLSLAAAARCPHRHGADADQFDVARPSRRDHVPFGYGVHHCVGRPLARLEVSIALESLFARYPRMAAAVPEAELAVRESFISSGHVALPVVLVPGAAA